MPVESVNTEVHSTAEQEVSSHGQDLLHSDDIHSAVQEQERPEQVYSSNAVVNMEDVDPSLESSNTSGKEELKQTEATTEIEIQPAVTSENESVNPESIGENSNQDISSDDVVPEPFTGDSNPEMVVPVDEVKNESEKQANDENDAANSENSSSSASSSASENEGSGDEVGQTNDQDEPSQRSDNVNRELLEKQYKLIKESKILQNSRFKNASETEQISALIAVLNSDPQTSMPYSGAASVSGDSTSDALEDKKRRFPRPDLTQPMNALERERYAEYLNGETKITEIQSFPPKSRLFIGNLPLKNVSKDDLFRIFSPYGHIFQINIKNAFGFIQYDNPSSVLDAIEYESEELNFGKKLILEVSSSNARPQFDHGDHGSNTSSTYVTSSKRNYDQEEAEEEDFYSDNYKKTKKRTPQCLIYVKKAADRTYAYNVFKNMSKKTGLETDMVILKPRMELRKLVNDAAYDGVWGVILVNKNKNVDVQTFYQGPSGETKSDEYVAVSVDEAISIFNNIKSTRMMPPSISPVMNSTPYGMPPPPATHPQQYGGNIGMMPQQQMYANVPPPQNYGMPPQQQMYGNMAPPQNYGMPPQQPYQGYPPQQHQQQMMSQQGGLDQNQLLAALQNLPPNVVSNLLQLAQQPNQQQQQQALGVIQQIQAGIPLQQQQQQQLQQQPPQQPLQQPVHQQQPYRNYMSPQGPAVATPSQPPSNHQPDSYPQNQPQHSDHNPPVDAEAQAAQVQNNNNVQSLLDSLAKLQK